MKIGFSFGRCLRDIVNGEVSYDDVYLIVTRTAIHDSTQVDDVVEEYFFRADYLAGLDEATCFEIGKKLYLDGKLYQPRLYGKYPRQVSESAIWMDLMPVLSGEDVHSEQVMQAWKSYQLALKMTTLQKFPSKEEANERLKDDF